MTLAVIGGPAEASLGRELAREAGVPVLDLCGRLSLSALAILLREAAVLISNDTGPVHIAAAAGTPVVSIFGRNQPGLSPVRWRPIGEMTRVVWRDVGCNPCLAHACRIHFLCLDVISAAEVLKELESLGPGIWEKLPFAAPERVS